jgi:hypothetical protein
VHRNLYNKRCAISKRDGRKGDDKSFVQGRKFVQSTWSVLARKVIILSLHNYVHYIMYVCSKILVILSNIWAATGQNKHCAFSTSMNPDQPAHPRSLIRIPAVRLQTLLQVEKLKENGMDPDQTGLDPCWSQTHYVGFVVTLSRGSYLVCNSY